MLGWLAHWSHEQGSYFTKHEPRAQTHAHKTKQIMIKHSTGRASIRDLQRLIIGMPSSSSSSILPTHLASILDEAATNEDRSNLSNEAYDNVVREMASCMSSTVASYGERIQSESVYNPELLAVCELSALFPKKGIIMIMVQPKILYCVCLFTFQMML